MPDTVLPHLTSPDGMTYVLRLRGGTVPVIADGDTVSEDIECAGGGALVLLTSEVPEPIPDHMVRPEKLRGGVTV